ncbi:type II toxin-antitoxin system Phd/YefM family antitoxin [Nitrosococcus wardiae]|uniref:Type II toxin-antitoxin system Phd/YefM family antitoxin n=1 Tax=Nitrosococcus wardiae TaxID=1814290 RepID=A0A4P7BWR1_9GAMM|nr:type II toxin-antitoxin system Phd/YefM family antitoxin [Nitrosococcus wardiae]QBQ53544.1 type II toxin-antitoxin system Phd/YefM family antitoxin [Nitrosococcus wardiae]
MIQHLSPSRLRANLYRILDYVLESGEPVEIERKGRRLRIVVEQGGKLDLLKPHPEYLKTRPEDIVHMDWSQEWRP